MKTIIIPSGDIYQYLYSKFGMKLPFLISAKDLKGNVVFANEHFDMLEGPGHKGFMGKNIYDLFPFEVAHELWMNDMEAVDGNCAIKKIEKVKHTSGDWHEYLTLKMPLLNKDNRVIGTIAFSILTPDQLSPNNIESMHINSEFNNAFKFLRHELLTPLASITGFTQILQRELGDNKNERVGLIIQHILDASEHMNDMIIREVSSNPPQYKLETFNLADICRQCASWLENMANSHGLTIIFNNHTENSSVFSCKLDIRQVLLNFLTNAIKYSIGNSPIIMELSLQDPETLKLKISNNGERMTEQDLAHIFNEGVRLASHSPIAGQGLGLSIVKRKLESLGCTVGVNSTSSGLNTFWFNIKTG